MDKPKLPGKFKQMWSKIKFKLKELNIKFLDKIRKIFFWIIGIDIDFVFVFFASFILTVQYLIWQRLLFSIGLIFLYKLIIKDVIRIKNISRGK